MLPFACLGAVVQCSGVVFKLVQSESSYLHCIGMGKEVLLLEPYSVQCTVYRVQFIVYSVQCTVYRVHILHCIPYTVIEYCIVSCQTVIEANLQVPGMPIQDI